MLDQQENMRFRGGRLPGTAEEFFFGKNKYTLTGFARVYIAAHGI